jgi:hypothetical protein
VASPSDKEQLSLQQKLDYLDFLAENECSALRNLWLTSERMEDIELGVGALVTDEIGPLIEPKNPVLLGHPGVTIAEILGRGYRLEGSVARKVPVRLDGPADPPGRQSWWPLLVIVLAVAAAVTFILWVSRHSGPVTQYGPADAGTATRAPANLRREPMRESTHGLGRVRPESASLTITTEPTGASLTVDGNAVGTSPLTTHVPLGTHFIRASLNTQHAERTIAVKAGNSSKLSLTLPQLPRADTRVAVSVRSVPSGARLSIDGDPMGTTPYEGRLRPGSHEFRAVLGNRRAMETRSIRADGNDSVLLRLQESAKSGVSVTIRSDPPNALVTIDGRTTSGRTPYQTRLDPRTEPYGIGLSLDGYPDGAMDVEVTGEPGAQTEFIYRFRRPRQ